MYIQHEDVILCSTYSKYLISDIADKPLVSTFQKGNFLCLNIIMWLAMVITLASVK